MEKPLKTALSVLPGTGLNPPGTLAEPGRSLWNRVLAAYDIRDIGGLELLAQACHAADRAAAVAARIEVDGAVLYDAKGAPRSHPAIKDELACRALIGRMITKLGLDVEPLRPGPGRPSYGRGWRPE